MWFDTGYTKGISNTQSTAPGSGSTKSDSAI
jgi:hypothetical protein